MARAPGPIVSVVVPTYRRPLALAECLNALGKQQFPDLEVIVVNDGGPSVADVIAAAPLPVRLVELPRNVGQVAARNHGISLARGSLLCLCDDDDVLLPPHLRQAVAKLAEGYDLAYSDAELVTFTHTPSGRVAGAARPFAFAFDLQFLRRWNFIALAAGVYRRCLHDELGMLDPDMGHYFDWDWWLRVATAGKCIARIPVATAIIAVDTGGDNQSAAPLHMRPDLERLARRHSLGALPSCNFWRMLGEPEVQVRQAATRRIWRPQHHSDGPPVPG